MFISKKKLEMLLKNERMNVNKEYEKMQERERIDEQFERLWSAFDNLSVRLDNLLGYDKKEIK